MREVVVIGGGLAGCSVAIALSERGFAVNVVDAYGPGSAATGASAGMLAPQYESDGPGPLFRVLVEARAYFREFAARLESLARQRLHVRWDGMLVANLSAEEHQGAEDAVTWQRREGQAAELVEVDEALRIQPGVTTSALSYLWLPQEGQADSQLLPEMLESGMAAAGIRTMKRCTAARLRHDGAAVEGVELQDGRFLPADAVVVASGAWSGTLDGLPRTLPVRPVRGHLLRFVAPQLRMQPLVAGHAGRYLVPRDDGSVLAGSTMDESGFDRSVDDDKLGIIREAAARLVPAIEALRPVSSWADLRPISLDGLPILGADPDLEGLFYATGYGRNGILLAPLAGRVLAELLAGHPSAPDWIAFSPSRL
jgi:glycine oxidase